jgi:endoglycosylceramidase
VGGESRPCSEVNADIFRGAEEVSRRTGDALLLSEFGANVRYPDSVVEAVTLADQFMVGWQHWAYATDTRAIGATPPDQLGAEGILVDDPRKPPEGTNVAHDTLDLLVRPYPQAIAGTPVRWEFDPSTRHFEFVYRARSAGNNLAPRAKTEVVVPRLQYPEGYRAHVKGGRVTSRRDARIVLIKNGSKAPRITLRVNPVE